MRIEKFGVSLNRIKEADIELVRVKRNLPQIAETMDYRKEISPEEQLKWFRSINNRFNYYFVINYNGEKIGLINGINIDFDKHSSEGGIFLWEQKYIGSTVPVLCSLLAFDGAFFLQSILVTYGKVLNSNKRSITYNKLWGYKPTAAKPGTDEFKWYELTKEDYLRNVPKFRNAIGQFTGDFSPLTEENLFFDDDTAEDIELLYKNNPPELQECYDRRIKLTFKG